MRMEMTMTLRLECDVCKQVIDEDKRLDSAVQIQLFGVIPFAICPCCGQEVQQYQNKYYRRRALKWRREHQASAYHLLQWVTVTHDNTTSTGIITSIKIDRNGIITYGVSTPSQLEVTEEQLAAIT